MIIYIADISGETHELTVLPTDRILYLKVQIGRNLGLGYNSFDLYYDGKILNNDDCLDYINVTEHSLLNLSVDLSKMLLVKTLSRRSIRCNVDFQLSTVYDLKCEIQKIERNPPDQQRFFFSKTTT